MSLEALRKAIQVSGGQAPLAEKLGKKQAHISVWLNRDKKVPADMVLKIELATGVPRHELRPDIYPPDEYEAVAEVLQQKKVA
ncbi:transcriptional regulator [Pseudoalteromonas sp. T1lg22]|uniref:transcriptional regulator n=1 Tax=Pseudoalteromonas sp. T1lg22 TaxID=2077096 RepID=UPI000CF6F50E|nr:YdaS family helix-turn-helix protein [Pseudoalteromonas sp. T1lg22]